MSSSIARKKSGPIGFTKKENAEMRAFDAATRLENRIFEQAMHVLIVAAVYVLRIKYSYGKKRLERFITDYAVVEEECKADRMDMAKFVCKVDELCGTSGAELLKQIPAAQKLYITGWARKATTTQRIAEFKKAVLWWYAITGWVLHKAFGFSKKEMERFLSYEVDLIDTLCRVKQFGVTTAMIRETIEEETGVAV